MKEVPTLVRLPATLHRLFKLASVNATVSQADLYRALVQMFLEDEELATRAIARARRLRDERRDA